MKNTGKKKILFLGETYRADAQTWINGLKEFGNFEIYTFELKTRNIPFAKIIRAFDSLYAIIKIRLLIIRLKPDMVIAERVTSYGFLAATTGFKKIAIAQQGITDIFPPNSISVPIKKLMQYYAFKKATLIHAWGKAMTISMFKTSVQKEKILVLPKGVKIDKFNFNIEEKNWDKIHAIVTRSLFPEYRHETIIKAFKLVDNAGIDFELVIVGGGELEKKLKDLAQKLNISSKIVFSGRIPNEELPDYLNKSNLYLSMPITEGVSSSLFEAMACGCYPIVSNIIGNRSWIENDINGNLVDIDNIESLAEKIINYWKNKENSIPAIIKNRKFVEENASLEKNMKIISKLYHQIIG